jgi:hypothetical protein
MAEKKKKEFKELPVGADAVQFLEFRRGAFHHFVRWGMLLAVLTLLGMLLLTSYKSHVLMHNGFQLKELVGYCVCLFMMGVMILPSVVLEVNYIKTGLENIVFHNLLFRRTERWENITQVIDPRYLKFVIVRTKNFVYLLNRRDIGNFDKLVETIKEKAVNAKI